jgi:hypothetical protein
MPDVMEVSRKDERTLRRATEDVLRARNEYEWRRRFIYALYRLYWSGR